LFCKVQIDNLSNSRKDFSKALTIQQYDVSRSQRNFFLSILLVYEFQINYLYFSGTRW